MELISPNLNIDFIGKRYLWLTFSLIVSAICIYWWVEAGDKKYGIDFAGGTDVVVSFAQPASIGDVRSALEKAGIKEPVIQAFEGGTKQYSIRIRAEQQAETGKRVKEALLAIEGNTPTILRDDYVGPVIGEQIRRDGLKAFLLSNLGILIYLAIRFEMRFAIGAIVALVHDAIVAGGLYVLYGYEISAAFLAAILTIVGYSVNDTIIVFDRIRENVTLAYKSEGDKKKVKKEGGKKSLSEMTMGELMNLSINQTVSRTILTSATAFFVSLTLWLYGGGAVAELAFALSVGIVTGTYSSIYIASPIVLMFEKKHLK